MGDPIVDGWVKNPDGVDLHSEQGVLPLGPYGQTNSGTYDTPAVPQNSFRYDASDGAFLSKLAWCFDPKESVLPWLMGAGGILGAIGGYFTDHDVKSTLIGAGLGTVAAPAILLGSMGLVLWLNCRGSGRNGNEEDSGEPEMLAVGATSGFDD